MASLASFNRVSVHGAVARSAPVALPRPAARARCVCRSSWQELIAAAGDVDAPIGVIVGGAIVVTLVATAIVPLALSPGQSAADQIFDRKGKKREVTTVKPPMTKKRRPGGR